VVEVVPEVVEPCEAELLPLWSVAAGDWLPALFMLPVLPAELVCVALVPDD